MKFLRLFSLIALLAGYSDVPAELVLIDDAIEATDIRVSVDDSGEGFVRARACEDCSFVRLEITNDTKITVNGETVENRKNLKHKWDGGVVIYNIKSKQVMKLML